MSISTSSKAASSASKILQSKSNGKNSKSAAGSTLSQTKSPRKETSKSVASKASQVYRDDRTSKVLKIEKELFKNSREIENKKKVFISFDFDNDRFLKEALIGQSKLPNSPFKISDWSLKEEAPEKLWEKKALFRIKRADIIIVLLGDKTHKASGVIKEIDMARNHFKKVIQLKPQGTNPRYVNNGGIIYNWTWENLQKLLA